jgi:LysR family glycine cleavage system transcriptional activator
MIVPSHLKALQALELAVRTGSLKETAERLAITPAAAGQRIKSLEDHLGVELVVRSRTGLRPTAPLEPALPSLAQAFVHLGAVAEMLDLQRFDEIHLAANSDWAELWLAPRLPRFRAGFPSVRFCINGIGDAPMRIGRADVDVTFSAPRDDAEHMVLFRDFLLPVGSQENVRRIARRQRDDRLVGFPLLHLDFYKEDPAAIDWPRWLHAHGHRSSALTRGIRFGRIEPGLQAVASDAGFMICGLALIAERIDAGDFALPFPPDLGAWTSHAFQARFRTPALRRKPVNRFRGWLADESRMTRDWLDAMATRR